MHFLIADTTNSLNKPYHLSSALLAIALPASIILPKTAALPFDLGLAVLLPFHAHVGLNYIISDYVPKNLRGLARLGVLGLSTITFLGLAKLTIDGPGVGGTLTHLWKKPASEEKEEN